MTNNRLLYVLCLLISLTGIAALQSCTDDNEPVIKASYTDINTSSATDEGDDILPVAEGFKLCKGADVSWLTQMEDEGIKFYYDNGTQGDCIDILKSKGVNAIRLRVWVNPPSGYNALTDVVKKAKRASAAGLDIMIDFHYSDDWADPGKQTIPTAWQGKDLAGLCQAVADHTTEVLSALKQEGVTPKWVQVGNETGNGMLWPYGKADSNPAGYAKLVNAGYDAVKQVCPNALVIIHLQNGQDQSLYKWLFDILRNNGANYDVIGMSLYPEPSNYSQMLSQCRTNMASCIERYGKKVMLCEVGMGNSYVTECGDFLKQTIALSEVLGDNYLGVLYWEPEVYNDWSGYRKGAFTSQGRPGEQLDAFMQADTSLPMITL